MVMVSARIRDEDKHWLEQHNIGITELINTAIFHRKNELEGFATNFTEERNKREAFQKKFSKCLQFMEEKGIIDEWIANDIPEKKTEEVLVRGI